MTTTHALSSASAGRRGPDVRSDCWVGISRAENEGVDLAVQSKVAAMYGDSIGALVHDTLAQLDVTDVHVELEDAGALPFVLQARIEAAVRRMLEAEGTPLDSQRGALPAHAPNTDYPTARERFRRSRLYLPGNEPKFMLNAGLHGPDGVILDLEDSVALDAKDEARILVRNALRSIDFCGAERMVRINQGARGLDDLDFIAAHNVHVVLIPKVEDPEQVRVVDARCAALRQAAGRAAPILLMPIVESALGALRAYEIATASENVCALTIGLEDYTADIHAERTEDGRESFWARSQVVNAARAARVQPIDTVYSDVANEDGLRNAVLEAKGLGFDGKGCIHPRQIRVIHEAFAPKPAELERARAIVAAFEHAQERGLAAVSLGSKMIDPPVVKRAQHVVALAAALERSPQ